MNSSFDRNKNFNSMKQFTLILITIASLFFLFSCSSDDNGTNPNAAVEAVAGTYKLESFTAPTPQDLNQDGVASANLVGESDCYSEWQIVLKADRTFTRQEKIVNVVDGAITCTQSVDMGTWDIQANMVKLTLLDETELNSDYIYLDSNKSLTQSRQSEFPTIFEEVFIIEGGTVNLIYVRQ